MRLLGFASDSEVFLAPEMTNLALAKNKNLSIEPFPADHFGCAIRAVMREAVG